MKQQNDKIGAIFKDLKIKKNMGDFGVGGGKSQGRKAELQSTKSYYYIPLQRKPMQRKVENPFNSTNQQTQPIPSFHNSLQPKFISL